MNSPQLHTLILWDLLDTTKENRACLLDFVAEMCEFTESLTTLYLHYTATTGEQGDKLMNSLADAEFATLQHLNISQESWFTNGRMDCFPALLALLSR